MNTASNPSYNYDNFRSDIMYVHMQFDAGPEPGTLAPNINLPTVAGGRFDLQSFFGKRMVLIEVGSITCPMASAARGCLNRIYHGFKKHLELVSVYVREAHPNDIYPQHRTAAQKMQHASDWVRMGERPWTVAIDTLDGETHLAYLRAVAELRLPDRPYRPRRVPRLVGRTGTPASHADRGADSSRRKRRSLGQHGTTGKPHVELSRARQCTDAGRSGRDHRHTPETLH